MIGWYCNKSYLLECCYCVELLEYCFLVKDWIFSFLKCMHVCMSVCGSMHRQCLQNNLPSHPTQYVEL